MNTLILINKNKGHKMKKLTLAILLLLASFSMVSAEIGFKIGVSAQLGEFETSGSEVEDTDDTSAILREQAFIGMGSFFIEQNLGFLPGPLKRVSLGYSNVMHDLKSGTSSNVRTDLGAAAGAGANVPVTQSISVDLQNIESYYATIAIFDWLYVKGGSIDFDVKTTENLETGGTYPNTALSGDVYGFGLHHQTDSGFFGRVEYLTTDIGGVTLVNETNSNTSVTLKELTGETLQVSFGKAF